MDSSSTPLPTGRTVLVTGGARRIGRAICLAFARRRSKIVVHCHESRDEAEELVGEIAALGSQAVSVSADFENAEEVARLAGEAASAFGGLDLLVNNASTWPAPGCGDGGRNFEEETPGEWDRALAVNVRAPFFLLQHLAPVLLRSDDPHVVNLLDESVTRPFPDRSSHSVSKAALWSVTRLASEHFAGRIRVHGLELGYVLPFDERKERRAGKADWCGTDRLVQAIARILQDTDRHAGIGRWQLAGDGGLTWKIH